MRHDGVYGVHEVYYDDDGKIFAWTLEPGYGLYQDVEDLLSALKTMLKDCRKSKDEILDYDMKPETKPPWEGEADPKKGRRKK